jgi:hypothetical protein
MVKKPSTKYDVEPGIFREIPCILDTELDPGNAKGRSEPLRLADVFLPQIERRYGACTQIGEFDSKGATMAATSRTLLLANCDPRIILTLWTSRLDRYLW